MPPKRTTAKSTEKTPPHRLSARIAASKATSDYEETIDINAELTDTDEDSNTKEASKKAGSQLNAAPSVPSELATTQGRTAYDVRYFFFPLPNKV